MNILMIVSSGQQRYVKVISDAMAPVDGVQIFVAGVKPDAEEPIQLGKKISFRRTRFTLSPYISPGTKAVKNAIRFTLKLFDIEPVKALDCLKKISPRCWVNIASEVQHHCKVRTWIGRSNPDLIILLEDNVGNTTGIASHFARRRKIPVIILPDYIPNPLEPALFYLHSRAHSGSTWSGRLVRTIIPSWVYNGTTNSVLRLPVEVIITRYLLGHKTVQPWILNSGYAHSICIDSAAIEKLYKNLGFRGKKLKILGSVVDDILYERQLSKAKYREAMSTKYGCGTSGVLVVCGFPPDQYLGGNCDKICQSYEYKTYKDLCAAWIEELREISRDATVLVVPHPRLDPSVLKPYLSQRIQLVSEKLEEVIDLTPLKAATLSGRFASIKEYCDGRETLQTGRDHLEAA